MILSPADLAAYRQRIGWHDAAAADRATLDALVAHHTAAIPFENLDPLIGKVPDLAVDALIAKLVHAGRGGYCYEQNGLFKAVLETIGFAVTGLAARVMWGVADGAVLGRTHMALLVDLPQGPVIVDVGFGSQTLTGVLDLVDGIEQPTPHGAFRLVRDGAVWRQESRILDTWRPVYAFDLQPQLAPDYELGNWWAATGPASRFPTTLIASRALPGRRLALCNFDLSIHDVEGQSRREALAGPGAVCDLLESGFSIRLPERDALERRLAEIAA